MPALKLMSFAGEVPRMSPRLLPEGYAQHALNCHMLHGTLTPLRVEKEVATAASIGARTIYKFGRQWITWDNDVDVAPAPVDSNPPRIYFTGDGLPKYREGEVVHRIGVPRPAEKLTVTITGEATDKAVPLQTRIYVYTYVSEIGEESAPSPVSDFIEWGEGMATTISGMQAPPAGRRIDKIRIYRSQSTSGATKMQFAVELPASTTTWTDNVPATRLAEVLPSQEWTEPPESLRGLTSLPNGVLAGFVGKTLWFCEPFTPYAWPESYTLACDYEIVALAAIGTMLVVATTGNPYVVQGTDPASFTMEKLEVNYPCVSPRSMVDMGYAAIYASHHGLVSVSAGGAVLMTEQVFTQDQWQSLSPVSIQAGEHAGYYVGSYETLAPDGTDASGTLMIRPTGDMPYVTRVNMVARSFFTDIRAGALYFNTDKGVIYQFNPSDRPYMKFEWRSKMFVSPKPNNMGAGRVDSATEYTDAEKEAINAEVAANKEQNNKLFALPLLGSTLGEMQANELRINGSIMLDVSGILIGDQFTTLALYGDGRKVAETNATNRTFRLPPGYKARVYEIVLSGNGRVFEVVLAGTGAELATA